MDDNMRGNKKTTCSYLDDILAQNEVIFEKKRIMKEKIMPRLHQEAEKRTWDFLQNLVEQRKAPDFADSALKNANFLRTKYPDFSFRIHLKHSMYYYFIDKADTPYSLLFVNRVKENGEKVAQLESSYTYAVTVKQHQEYLMLKGKIERCDDIKFDPSSYDYNYVANLERVKEIAKQSFEDLTEYDAQDCYDEIIYFMHLLRCFDEARDFCFLLLDKNVQEELEDNEEVFLAKMNQKYKACANIANLRYFIGIVDSIEQQRRKRKRSITNEESMPEPDAREMISAHLEAEKMEYIRSTNHRSVYIKIKLAVAEEIGLITKNEKTGYYEEMYGDFFDKTVEELRLEYAD